MAIYMSIDGPPNGSSVHGSVAVGGYQDSIKLTSLQWGRRLAVPTTPDRGFGTGVVSMNEIVVTKRLDLSSPDLFSEFTQRKFYREISFVFTKTTAGRTHTFLEFKIFDVLISRYELSSSGDAPDETLALNYLGIEYNYMDRHQEPTGRESERPKRVTYYLQSRETMPM